MTKLTKIEQNIQAILFAAGEPYEKERLAKLLEIDRQTLEQLVERINESVSRIPRLSCWSWTNATRWQRGQNMRRSSGRRWRSRTTPR